MFEQALLAEQFQSLLVQAQQAERMYASLAEGLSDQHLLREVERIHQDKQRHVRLAERLLEIVQ